MTSTMGREGASVQTRPYQAVMNTNVIEFLFLSYLPADPLESG